MTTDTPTTAPTTTPATLTGRRALAAAAALGTLPYLTMKIAWLTGNPVGVTDPALLGGGSMVALNAVTVLLDLGVVVLAAALASRRALRLPALAVLLPGWIATGLLVPNGLVALPLALLAPDAGDGGLAGWVRPMVYGGFAWQALCLLSAFALYARDRWWDRAVTPGPVPEPVRPLLRATAGGGAVVGTLSAVLLAAAGIAGGSPVTAASGLVSAVAVLAGVAGVLALARGRSGPVVVAAAWTGSAVAFAGGLWTAVTTMGATALSAAGHPAYGLGYLAGTLGGFALAVAALLAVSGSRPR